MNPERRIYPRINVSIPGEVEDATGVSADITILNLSVNGVLIEGDQASDQESQQLSSFQR